MSWIRHYEGICADVRKGSILLKLIAFYLLIDLNTDYYRLLRISAGFSSLHARPMGFLHHWSCNAIVSFMDSGLSESALSLWWQCGAADIQ